MKRIMVVGAGGQIGSELVPYLRSIYGASNVVATDVKHNAVLAEAGPFESLDALDAKQYAEVKVSDLNKFEDGAVIDVAALIEAGIVRKENDGLKVLGRGEISKKQATDMLTKYTDMSDKDITKTVNEWSAVVVTGIAYDDIDDEFMAGKITASRAIEMYMRYGGMAKEDATEKVYALSFVKEHPSLEGESVSYKFVTEYTEYCEPKGIDVKVAYDVWKYAGGTESDKDDRGEIIVSKKEKVLEYIDSLGLSRKQKDALYYALGYAKSTIKDAPWR